MTWAIDSSIPAPYGVYIDELLALLYPNIVTLYGEPPDTFEITVRYDGSVIGGYYDPSSREMVLGALPNDGSGDTSPSPDWDYFIAHEFIHAFHDGYYFESWIEEGMTEGCNMLLVELLEQSGERVLRGGWDLGIRTLWYDTFAVMGREVLGGVAWSRAYADWVSGAESYSGLFALAVISQVEGDVGLWSSVQALAEINAGLYALPLGEVYDADYLDTVDRTLMGTLDGVPAAEWFRMQPIASDVVPEGRFLGVTPFQWNTSPVSPSRIAFFAFEWGPLPENPAYSNQQRIETGEPVSIEVRDVGRALAAAQMAPLITESLDYPNGNGVSLEATEDWTFGAYRVDAEVELGSDILRARNYFIAGYPPIWTAEDGLGVIAIDLEGELLAVQWTSEDCSVLQQGNAAAIVLPGNQTTLPSTCTLAPEGDPDRSHTVTVPLPGTRVVVLTVDSRGSSPSDGGIDGGSPLSDGGDARPERAGGCSCSSVGFSASPGISGLVVLMFLGLAVKRRRA